MSKVDVAEIISKLKFDAQGLIPAIVQESSTWQGLDPGVYESARP